MHFSIEKYLKQYTVLRMSKAGESSELYIYWDDNSRQNPCFCEAKMAATTINVVNSFSTIFPSYLLFFKKTVSKTRL